ncbi:unnamed protein product [Cladocopium goreaui]|uniref:Uncharacterized protein n=1 Tax=Cladocopium goreaui TaxID=2562237 RepID=A0A9P1G1K8_9DINO|nr:unnamed protein product [Cladocopium goreaui]
MLGTPWAWLQIKLQHGIPKPALWRWGAVSAIIPKVLALKHLLQQVWNPTKFANPAGEAASEAQQREAEEGGEDPDFQQQLVTETLRSEQWWLYTTMLGKLAQFSEDMTHWAEGCACHSWLHRKNAVQEVDEAEEPLTARDHLVAARCSLRLTNGEGDGINFQCPLAGQRAVELASGELWVFLETLSRNYIQEILSSNSCTDADAVQEVLDDFALGKSSMVEQLRIKLRCWQSLPWVLAALNSADAQHAREVAAEAMSRYDASPQDSCLHHRLTQKYLRQGCVARTELDKFVAGASLSDLPTLRDFVWGLRFLPTAERIQEGDHSVVKSLVTLRANRISGPYVSCKLRFPEIVDVVCKSEECRKLLAYFESIQDPDSIALQFGFWRHPLWIEARKQRYTRRLKLQVAASILYAMDAETQFTQVRAAAEKRKKRKKEKAKRIAEALKTFLPQAHSKWTQDNVERVAVSHHLQQRLVMQRLYSFSQDALSFSSLCGRPVLSARTKAYAAVQDKDQVFESGDGATSTMQLCLDCEEQPLQLQLQSDGIGIGCVIKGHVLEDEETSQATSSAAVEKIVFLRVVSTHPSRRKTIALPPAEAAHLGPSDMCVSIHAAHVLNLEADDSPAGGAVPRSALCVSAEPESAKGIANHVQIFSLFAEQCQDIMALKQSMRAWTQRSTLLFGIKGCVLPAAAHAFLGKVVLARAFPTCPDEDCVCVRPADEAFASAVQKLEHMRVVLKRWEKTLDSSTGWSLTAWGTEQLIHMREVTHSQKVFRDSGALAALALVPEEIDDMTSWELLQVLGEQGWTLKRKDSKKKSTELTPVVRGSPRVWFDQDKKKILAEQGCEGGGAALAIEDDINSNITLTLDVTPLDMDPLLRLGFAQGEDAQRQEFEEWVDGPSRCQLSVSYEPSLASERVMLEAGNVEGIVSESDGDAIADNAADAALDSAACVVDGGEALDAPADAAPLPLPRAPRVIETHPDSFDWGPGGLFRVTWTPAEKRPPHGQWQIRCPFHRLNHSTVCTKAKQAGPTAESRNLVLRMLQTWALRAPLHTRKRYHASDMVAAGDVLPAEMLESKVAALPAPPHLPPTDVELDAAEKAAEDLARPATSKAVKATAKAAALRPERPAKKAKAKGKPKPKEKETAPTGNGDDCAANAGEESADSDSDDAIFPPRRAMWLWAPLTAWAAWSYYGHDWQNSQWDDGRTWDRKESQGTWPDWKPDDWSQKNWNGDDGSGERWRDDADAGSGGHWNRWEEDDGSGERWRDDADAGSGGHWNRWEEDDGSGGRWQGGNGGSGGHWNRWEEGDGSGGGWNRRGWQNSGADDGSGGDWSRSRWDDWGGDDGGSGGDWNRTDWQEGSHWENADGQPPQEEERQDDTWTRREDDGNGSGSGTWNRRGRSSSPCRREAEYSANRRAVSEQPRSGTSASATDWPKGWVWKTRSNFNGWKNVEGPRWARRSAAAKEKRKNKYREKDWRASDDGRAGSSYRGRDRSRERERRSDRDRDWNRSSSTSSQMQKRETERSRSLSRTTPSTEYPDLDEANQIARDRKLAEKERDRQRSASTARTRPRLPPVLEESEPVPDKAAATKRRTRDKRARSHSDGKKGFRRQGQHPGESWDGV